MKTLVNIDADLILYELGGVTDDEGHPLAWPFVKNRVDAKIRKIMEECDVSECELFITGPGNFRIEEATILPYKGNRKDTPKPHWHSKIKEYLLSTKNWKVTECLGMEADDMLSIRQTDSTILASRDKDLNMVPGTHYSWSAGKAKGRGLYEVSEEEAMKWFFTQLLTGDMTDNIRGIYQVGKVKAEKLLAGLSGALSWYTVCQAQYELRFGSYWGQFMNENARLLWMMTSEDNDVRDWFRSLERERLADKWIGEEY